MTIAGMFTVAAAINIAGVLSSPRQLQTKSILPSSPLRDSRLITPRQQHDPIQRIPKKHLYQTQIAQIPIQTRRRSFARLLDRMTWEFHSCPPCGDYTFADTFGELDMVTVAGG